MIVPVAMPRLRLVSVLLMGLLPTLGCYAANNNATNNIAEIPFWQQSAGAWLSENTYLGNDYQAKIAHYHTLAEIRLHQQHVSITEYKFYPAGSFSGESIGITVDANKGVLLQQEMYGSLVGGSTDVVFSDSPRLSVRLVPVETHSALMTFTDTASGIDLYRMFITMPTPASRISINLGINAANDGAISNRLRGVSIFSATRLADAEIDTEKRRLSALYQVATWVTQDKNGHFIAKTLEKLPL